MNRFFHTMRHEGSLQFRNIIITASAVAGSIMLISLLGLVGDIDVPNVWPAYRIAMPILGVILTSGAFSELRSQGHKIEFLLRPATVWEKTVSKLLISTVFVWVAVTVAFMVASLLATIAYLVVARGASAGEAFYRAFADGRWFAVAWETFVHYLPAHAIFFFGSAYFQKRSAGRTLLSMVAWTGSYMVAAIITVRIAFNRYFGYVNADNSGPPAHGEWRFELELNNGFGTSDALWHEVLPWYVRDPDTTMAVVSVIVVAAFWLLTVLRLRETEG